MDTRVDHCGIFGLNILSKDRYYLKKWGATAAASGICRDCYKSSFVGLFRNTSSVERKAQGKN